MPFLKGLKHEQTLLRSVYVFLLLDGFPWHQIWVCALPARPHPIPGVRHKPLPIACSYVTALRDVPPGPE